MHNIESIEFSNTKYRLIDSILINGTTHYLIQDEQGNTKSILPTAGKINVYKNLSPIAPEALLPKEITPKEKIKIYNNCINQVREVSGSDAYMIVDNIEKKYLRTIGQSINWVSSMYECTLFTYDEAKIQLHVMEAIVNKMSVEMVVAEIQKNK